VEGSEVEKIAEVLGKRLKGQGDGGSADMYTSVGANVLVALNPYAPLAKGKVGLYDDRVALHFWSASPHLAAPHVFKVASAALQRLVAFKRDQTVIVSGESGAGKTEAAKHVVTFLSRIASLANPGAAASTKGLHAAAVGDDDETAARAPLNLASQGTETSVIPRPVLRPLRGLHAPCFF
jgi:hypothetical protein